MRFRIKDGHEFEVTSVSATAEELRTLIEERTRSLVVYSVVGLMVVFLVGAAILGIVRDDFGSLDQV
jgi:hypothetical protein